LLGPARRTFDDLATSSSDLRPTDLVAVRTALQDAVIDYESAEASFHRRDGAVDLEGARKLLKLSDAHRRHDDVQGRPTPTSTSPTDVAAIRQYEGSFAAGVRKCLPPR